METSLTFAKGICNQMCPDEEIKIREREGLLHRFEMLSGTERQKRPKADRKRTIKAFSRSAAGIDLTKPKNLRPVNILLETVNYLLHDVIMIHVPWPIVYDFVSDRLNAVRQDMVVQNLPIAESISLLQPIVRFFAYSSYRLCETDINKFDPAINAKHLQDCLKKLLLMYDERDFLPKAYQEKRIVSDQINLKKYEALYLKNREYFEAMYIILNLGNFNALHRCLTLSKQWRTPLVENALEISLSYSNNNWVQACSLIAKLPPIVAVVAASHLPSIRWKAFAVMAVAYSSKNNKIPGALLKDILLYSSMDYLRDDCRYYNIMYDEETDDVLFTKSSFTTDKKVNSPRHEHFVNEKLKQYDLPTLMMYDKAL